MNNNYKNRNDLHHDQRNTRRSQKEIMDQRRRAYIERRRKRLEALRRDPVSYRRHQTKLRMEQRRVLSASASKSSSLENSSSLERNMHKNKTLHSGYEQKPRRIRTRRRRRRSKNCATKEPAYQWKTRNFKKHSNENKSDEENKSMYGKVINNFLYNLFTLLCIRFYHKKYSQKQKHTNRRNYESSRRSTRSVSKPRHVEVLLVADKSMTDFHNQGNLETYLLTIMNMVSQCFTKYSIKY